MKFSMRGQEKCDLLIQEVTEWADLIVFGNKIFQTWYKQLENEGICVLYRVFVYYIGYLGTI
jgi:hypothetical protein